MPTAKKVIKKIRGKVPQIKVVDPAVTRLEEARGYDALLALRESQTVIIRDRNLKKAQQALQKAREDER